MITLTWAKVALIAIGILIWAYGARVDNPTIRWAGIALLIAALLLRFLSRRGPPPA